MSGVSKIEIHEPSEQLLTVMKQQTKLARHERVHALYLLKSKEATSIAHAARILGRNRVTVQRWLSEYARIGLKGLLAAKAHGGRSPAIPAEVQAQLKQKLAQSSCFRTYGDIVNWLASDCGLQVSYWVVYTLVRQRWQIPLNSPVENT